ncbi:MAG TPA: hypothetical protein PKC14_04590 [Candidatus Absconditabacterales bacterium]|nr:hypothetical protein [Candidatus Absconditabacterales bacterium]
MNTVKLFILMIGIILAGIFVSCGKSDPYKMTGVAITENGESLIISDPLIESIEIDTWICLTNVDMKKNWKISNQCGNARMTNVINNDSIVIGSLVKAKLIKKQ